MFAKVIGVVIVGAEEDAFVDCRKYLHLFGELYLTNRSSLVRCQRSLNQPDQLLFCRINIKLTIIGKDVTIRNKYMI